MRFLITPYQKSQNNQFHCTILNYFFKVTFKKCKFSHGPANNTVFLLPTSSFIKMNFVDKYPPALSLLNT